MSWLKKIERPINWISKRGWGIIILILLGFGIVKEGFFTGLTLPYDGGATTKRITGIVDSAGSGSALENLVTEYYLQQALAGLALGSGNKMEVYNVRDYGAIPNVSVPATGPAAAGTNQQSAFSACYAAVPRGGIMFVGPGEWLVTGGLTFSTKDVVYIQVGNVHTNGTSYLTFNPPGGADRVHSAIILGKIIGRENIPTNSLTTRANGTSPQWSSFTGTGITIGTNVNNMHIKVKWIEGFFKAVEILSGGGGGSQENTIAFLRFWYNAIGISFRNTTGEGWVDKNTITGWDNGIGRITGGLCFKADGFSGAAPSNGEVFNGAVRSNSIKFLAERVDSLVEIKADFTYNKLEIIPEGGSSTGVFAQTNAMVVRTSSPNPARNTKWGGQGVLGTQWMAQGLGIDGTVDQDVYLNSAIFVGNHGTIDGAGNIIMEVSPTFSQTNRNNLPAIIKCVNKQIPKVTRALNQPTYSTVAADAEGTIISNYLSGAPAVITMGSTASNVGVTIYVINSHVSNNLTLFNVSNKATLGPGETAAIREGNGTWRAIVTGTSYTPAP